MALGPAALNSTIGGVAIPYSGGYASGRIAGIAVDPTNPSNIYVAAAGGGAWNTTDGGATWSPLTDNQPTLAMGSIAIAPSNPSVIYAGTGEANNSVDSEYGYGILVSNDGGQTWALSAGPGNIFQGRAIGRIAIDPTNAQVAYAAVDDEAHNGGCYAVPSNCTGTGIFKTTDGGQTWNRVTPNFGFHTMNTWSDVVIDPDATNIIYAAEGDYPGASDNGVYRSRDSGVTWSELSGLPNGNNNAGRIALAAGPGHVLYVAEAVASFGASKLLYMGRSDNANADTPTFTDLTPDTPNFAGQSMGGGGQGTYDFVIGVDPADSSHVFAAGSLNYDVGPTDANGVQIGSLAILESHSSGGSWDDITTVNGIEPHTDYHAMAFDSNSRLLAGNDGGIWAWDGSAWTNLNGNLNVTQFTGVSLHPTNTQIVIGGSQDNGTELYTGNPVWQQVAGGDGGFPAISQTNPSMMYQMYFGGQTFVSFDAGNTFSFQLFPFPGLTYNPSLFNFYSPIFVDPTNGNRFLIGGDAIYETLDDINWSISPNPCGLAIDALTVLPGTGVIYFSCGGTFNLRGFIYKSIDDGAHWAETNQPPGDYHINELDIDPNDPTGNTVVALIDRAVTTTGHVYRTTDGGGTWVDISSNLPVVPAQSAKIDIDSAHTIYIANDMGVYSAPSPYVNWLPLGAGLSHAQGVNLQLNTNPHELVLATHGRGAWQIGSLGIGKEFDPDTIGTGQASVVTLTLSNTTGSVQTGVGFTDTLVNMQAAGGPVSGTCSGTIPASLTAGASALSFSGITMPDQSSCTVIFTITSSTPGVHINTTSGLTAPEFVNALPALPGTAALTVLAPPTIGKAFNPASIQSGANSVLTLTLSNSNTSSDLTAAAFTDTLVHMSALGGAVTGTCTGTAPNSLAAGATALSFSGITIPAGSNCTVILTVTSATAGVQPNTTSGVTTTETSAAGPVSNTANLTVLAAPAIAKAFNPASIPSGGNSMVMLTLSNSNASALTNGFFTDTLVHMSALGGAVTGTCAGTSPNSLAAGATALSFTGITIPASGNCTVIFSVTSNNTGGNPNRTSGVTTDQTTTAGAPSNSAVLTVLGTPVIAKAFNPSTIETGANSVVTLTLSNSNASGLTGGAFTDALANMTAFGGAVTGTCVGTTPNSLAAGATALSFTGIAIPANGSCTVVFTLTSNKPGIQPNSTSGVTTNEISTAGLPSNTATLTVLAPPTIANSFNPSSIQSSGISVLTVTLSNSNASDLMGGAFSDALSNMSAAGGGVTGTCAGTSPNSLAGGATNLSFTGITIPANAACTVIFSVTSTDVGANPNQTSGVTTTQTPVAGAASNIANLTVSAATLTSIAVTPVSPSIRKGATQQFMATGTYSDNSTQNLTNQVAWASATQTVATISAAGLASAVGVGTSNITAALNGITSPVDVLTVTAATLQSIAVTPVSPSIAKGLTQQFTATGTYSDNSTQNLTNQVTWASATQTVATINAAGLASAVGVGTSNITAALNGITSPVDVLTVTAATLQSIAVTPVSPSIAKGLTRQFTATGTYSDNSTQNLTNQVTWASATPSVATINNTGLASALGVGTSNITAALNGITSPVDVLTVTPAALQSIAVTPVSPSIAKGLTQQFTATGTYSDNSTQNLTSQVTWASATQTVATINAAGLASATGVGTSNITATLNAITSPVDVLTVTPASPPVVVSFSVLFGHQSYNVIGSNRNRLPWQITGIQVVFSKVITSGSVSSLSGVTPTNLNGLGTTTLTWTINPIVLGNFATALAGAGPNALTDAQGNQLAGGAGFTQAVKVLWADFNDDGVVNAADLVLVNNARSQAYNIMADLNGDGVVDINDVQIARSRNGTALP